MVSLSAIALVLASHTARPNQITPAREVRTDWSAALVRLADLTGLSVSPNGRFLLFRSERGDVASNGYDLRWYVYDRATRRLDEIGSGGRAVYDTPGVVRQEMPIWSPANDAAYVRRLDRDGAIALWRIDPAQRTMAQVAAHPGDVEELALANDGSAITYKVGPDRTAVIAAEQAEKDNGVVIDRSVDLIQPLVRGGSIDGRMASQRLVGYWTVRAGLLWRAPRQQWRFNFATGATAPVGRPQPVPEFRPPPVTAAAQTRRGHDWARAQWSERGGALDVGGDEPARHCQVALCTTQRAGWLQWVPGRRALLVGFQDRQLRQTLALWDLTRNRWHGIARIDGILSGGRTGRSPCAVSTDVAFCVEASAASPPQLVELRLASGRRTVIFDPNAWWRRHYQPVVTRMDLPVPDAPANAILLSPANGPGKATPLFINHYRCEGFLRGGEGDAWPLPALLDAGFSIACINAAPQQLPQNALRTYQAGLAAVRQLIEHLAGAGRIDSSKVAMGGFSFGSEVALWTAIHSDLLAAVSIASAQWEPSNYWYSALGGDDIRQMSRAVWGLGDPDQTRTAWDTISPARQASRIHVPMLLQMPEQEARQVPELVVRLRDQHTPIEFVGFPDEDHLIVQPRHRLAAYRRNEDWLRYWLQNWRDPDPAKQPQYERWDAMRRDRPIRSRSVPTPQASPAR